MEIFGNPRTFFRTTALCFALSTIVFSVLARVQANVIEKQRELIHSMTKNPACMVEQPASAPADPRRQTLRTQLEPIR